MISPSRLCSTLQLLEVSNQGQQQEIESRMVFRLGVLQIVVNVDTVDTEVASTTSARNVIVEMFSADTGFAGGKPGW